MGSCCEPFCFYCLAALHSRRKNRRRRSSLSSPNQIAPRLKDAITTTFDGKELKDGTAWIGHGADFFFAIEAASKPALFVDGASSAPMKNLSGSDLWYAFARIEPVGKLHAFYYVLNGAKDGEKFGGQVGSSRVRSLVLSAIGNSGGDTFAETLPHQQNLRWHEERILDLCARAIRFAHACGADGVSGWRVVSGPEWEQSGAQRHRQLDRSKENSGDDLCVHQPGRYRRLRPARPPTIW